MNSNNLEKLNVEESKTEIDIKNTENNFTSSDFVSLGATFKPNQTNNSTEQNQKSIINNNNRKKQNTNNQERKNFQNYNSDKINQRPFIRKGGDTNFDRKTKTYAQNNTQDYSNNFNDDSKKQHEKKFTGRCRLFVGNLPNDISEVEFKEMFSKYGEVGEVFLNNARSFGFIKLDTRTNAELAKQDLDGTAMKGRCIRVRFASHGAAVRVKNLAATVSNEYLEQAFSIFGSVERAVVIVDDKGRSTGEGIVEFDRKPAAIQCINKCAESCFLLTSYPKPVIVELLDQKDEEDGLSEKSIAKTPQYYQERDVLPRFVQNGSFDYNLAIKWKELHEQEKQFYDEVKKRVELSKEHLEYEIEQSLIDHKTMLLKEDLRQRQEELQRIEDFRKSEFQRRHEIEMRRQDWMRQAGGDMMNNQIKPEDNNNNNGLKGNYENQFNQQDSLINQNNLHHQQAVMFSNKIDVNRRFNFNTKKQFNNNNQQYHSNEGQQRQYGKLQSPSNLIAPQMLAVAAAAAAAAHINDAAFNMNNNNVRKRNQSDFRKNFKNMNNDRKRARFNSNHQN